jgi:hypothetical protein
LVRMNMLRTVEGVRVEEAEVVSRRPEVGRYVLVAIDGCASSAPLGTCAGSRGRGFRG